MANAEIYDDSRPDFYQVNTHVQGPAGKLPLTPEILKDSPSGDLFGMTQNAGMGWKPDEVNNDNVLIMSTMGGMRDANGNPVALGLHSGHFELNTLSERASEQFQALGDVPFATYVSDPCDGRSQGTTGMFDSLPYRNDAAQVMGRLIRSLPKRTAVMGISSCDKGLPATMMALVAQHDIPTILVPGGATRKALEHEDAGAVQTIGVRYAAGEISLDYAAEHGCRATASSGGGCQFLGTAATSQVIAEALGLALPHSALCVSGEPMWEELAAASARALHNLKAVGLKTNDIITDSSIRNAMIMHAAFGGSTNVLLHLTAIAHAAGCKSPTVEDWAEINALVPRIVSVLPVGPVMFPTGVVFLAGGVPEAMLRLRHLGLLDESVLTVTGRTLGENLDWWESSDRRRKVQARLQSENKVKPSEVILTVDDAAKYGLTSTVTFPKGNIAPQGSVVKSTAIDPSVIDENGVFRHRGPARVFTSEKEAMVALKSDQISAGDIMVIMGVGPMGTGMEETYQVTSALKKLPYGKNVSLITDARFSGVSTGACFGHVGPEALAGGPLGKLQEGDVINIEIDTNNLTGSIDFVGDGSLSSEDGAKVLADRNLHPGLTPDPDLPASTKLWAALQDVSGGTWSGCVYDVEKILEVIEAGKKALARQ